LHGWGGSADSFLFVAKDLCKNYRVTLVDFYGFGKSPEPVCPMTVPDYAQTLIELFREQKIEKAIIIAHSFGGRVAINLASKRADLVEKLVLIDSAGVKPRRKLSYYIKVLRHKIRRALGLKGLEGSSDYRVLSSVMKETFKLIVNYDQKKELKRIVAPTAIFWGEKDKETPLYMARIMNRKIKNSALFVLSGGHFSYIDDYFRFKKILDAFLDG